MISTRDKFINGATMFLMFVSLFIFSGMVLAQSDVYVGDEDLDVESGEVQIQQNTPEEAPAMDAETPASSSVDSIKVQPEQEPLPATPAVTKTIKTAPEEAPDAGPKEWLILAISVLVGLGVATFFLFRRVKQNSN